MASTTRRDFLATASAATLSALAAGFPRARGSTGRREAGPDGRFGHRALDGRRDGAHRDVRSEALHPVFGGPAARSGAEHVSLHRHRGRPHQVLGRAGADCARDGSRDADPQLHRRRSGLHPALAASISVAHRLRASADRGRTASGRDRFEDAGAARSRDAGVHQHRPAARRRRGRGAEGVYDGGVSWHRVRAVQRAVPRRSGRRGASPRRHVARPVREVAIASIAGCSRPIRSGRKAASISASR